MAGLIAAESVRDAGAYLARVIRLDPGAVVRLRPAPGGGVALWARLPFGVLATRRVRGDVTEDQTLPAAGLLDALGGDPGRPLPARRDADWRWPIPPDASTVIEEVPADDVRRMSAAAADTLRTAEREGVGGRPVGQRALRDALLDHVPLVVDRAGDESVNVPQRLVQGLVRMGFVGKQPIAVRVAGPWVGLAGEYGAVWHRHEQLLRLRPNG
jgi:hypothetical protein